MNARPRAPRAAPRASFEEARRLAQRLHDKIDAPLSIAIGAQGIASLATNSALATQVQVALRELSPNNSSRYSQAAAEYEPFWRGAVAGKSPYPQEIEIHPSAFCPLDCWYCCSPNKYRREKISPVSRNTRLIAYAQELDGILETVQISGGREPLEDGTLVDLLEGLRDERVAVRLNTSGFSSKKGRLGAISPYVDYMAVSIDGHTDQLYNNIKRLSKSGTLERVSENVRLAVADPLRKGRMEMVVLVLPENQDALEDLAVFAEGLGFDSVRFRRLKHHVVDGAADDVIHPPVSYDADLLNRIRGIRPSRPSFSVNVNSEDFLLNYDEYLSDKRSPCYSSNRKVVIDALGYVYPCALHSYPGPTGQGVSLGDPINIRDFGTFAELWDKHSKVISHYHSRPCSNCYIADRYINNFVARLAVDEQEGNIALAVSLFSGESSRASESS